MTRMQAGRRGVAPGATLAEARGARTELGPEAEAVRGRPRGAAVRGVTLQREERRRAATRKWARPKAAPAVFWTGVTVGPWRASRGSVRFFCPAEGTRGEGRAMLALTSRRAIAETRSRSNVVGADAIHPVAFYALHHAYNASREVDGPGHISSRPGCRAICQAELPHYAGIVVR